MNATTEQIEKATAAANKVIEMGCKLSFEKVFEIQLKKIQKQGWKPMSAKDVKKATSRENVENMEAPSKSAAEMMQENAMKNLPSSLRK
jgi:hypothetical protein